MIDARLVELDLGRLTQRIVDADLLDEATVARAARIGSNDTVEGGFLAASASETKSYGHFGGILLKNGLWKLQTSPSPVKVVLRGVGGFAWLSTTAEGHAACQSEDSNVELRAA
jgi:hypothetical protein